METYVIRQCQNDDCRFRFPSPAEAEHMAVCLKCEAATAVTHTPHHTISANNTPSSGRLQIQLLLDNIRSIYNVGSIFRTADGAGITHLHLCGITATPDNPKMAKTALGADSGMGWSYSKNGWDTAVALQKQGCQLWALENTSQAQSLFTTLIPSFPCPLVLIIGNEKAGVDPAILTLCDRVVSLPMLGIKESLNVAIALSIAVYHFQFAHFAEYFSV